MDEGPPGYSQHEVRWIPGPLKLPFIPPSCGVPFPSSFFQTVTTPDESRILTFNVRLNVPKFLQILLGPDMVRYIQPYPLRLNLLQATDPSNYAST